MVGHVSTWLCLERAAFGCDIADTNDWMMVKSSKKVFERKFDEKKSLLDIFKTQKCPKSVFMQARSRKHFSIIAAYEGQVKSPDLPFKKVLTDEKPARTFFWTFFRSKAF